VAVLAGCGSGSGSDAPPTEAISVSPQSIALGKSATLTWLASGATQCSAAGAWGGPQAAQGTMSVTPGSVGAAAYTLICANGNGQTSQTATLSVTPPAPTVSIVVAPATVTTGQSSTLTWSSTNATSCTASGAWNLPPSTNGTTQVSEASAGSYPFTLDCSNAAGSSSQTATLIVTATPYVSLSLGSASISLGQSATLTWSTVGASACTASGAWSTPALGGALSGTVSVTPTALGTNSYTLACSNDKGTTSESVMLSVTPPPPSVNLAASATAITIGRSVTLNWSSANTNSCSGNWLSAPLPLSGALAVTPANTGAFHYIVSCNGPGGSNDARVEVDVTGASMFAITDLVANSAGTAAKTVDPELVNPWGIAFAPGSAGVVANNGTATSTEYDGEGVAQPAGSPQTITFASGSGGVPFHPTGMVANPSTDFVVGSGATAKPAQVIYAGADGMIAGWAPGVSGNAAVTVYSDSSGAVYTGLALANNGAGNYLYAADFHGSKIDVFDGRFRKQTSSAAQFAFADPSLPSGYAPFGIQAIDNGSSGAAQLYVTYAQPAGANGAPKAGAGLGVIDIFDANGTFVKQLIPAGGVLNAPWGMALAPADFGTVGQSLVVGNVGDGRINTFDPASGESQGALADVSQQALALPGPWGISFGNDSGSQSHDALFVAAALPGSAAGSYARIDLVHATPVVSHLTVTGQPCGTFPPLPCFYTLYLIAVQVTSEVPITAATFYFNGYVLATVRAPPYQAFWENPDSRRHFHGTAHLTVTVTDADEDQASASTTFNVN
jgi:uncharacterized protein (TIGR03118 family)